MGLTLATGYGFTETSGLARLSLRRVRQQTMRQNLCVNAKLSLNRKRLPPGLSQDTNSDQLAIASTRVGQSESRQTNNANFKKRGLMRSNIRWLIVIAGALMQTAFGKLTRGRRRIVSYPAHRVAPCSASHCWAASFTTGTRGQISDSLVIGLVVHVSSCAPQVATK